jgi:hypothetical protein
VASVVMHMADMTVVRLLVRALDGREWRMLGEQRKTDSIKKICLVAYQLWLSLLRGSSHRGAHRPSQRMQAVIVMNLM